MTKTQKAATLSFVEKLQRAHKTEIKRPNAKQKADREAMQRHIDILKK